MENLPVSEIAQGNENNSMDIVSMALSNVTETANLMTVVDSNVVTEDVEEVQQFEQVEVVEQQVVQEIPIGSDDMVITTADGQIILPSNSTPAELSAMETLVGGALQQTVLSQPVTVAQEVVEVEQVAPESSIQETNATVVLAVPVEVSSTPGIVNLGHVGGGAQGISASSLLGSIATMIDSTESSLQASSGPSTSSLQLAGLKINTTSAPGIGETIVNRTVTPSNNVNLVTTVGQAVANTNSTNIITNNNSTSGTMTTAAVPSSNVTTMRLKSVLTPPSQSSLPSTITIKTPPGSNSVSQSLLNSILNNTDVQSLLRRNPGQPITIVRVPEDTPGGKSVNKITVTTGPVNTNAPGTVTFKKPPFSQTQGAKTYMRITTPGGKSNVTSVKSQPNTPNNSNPKKRPGRPPKVREPPPEPIVVKSKKTRSGRVSRPPIHRVRDYKTIHIQEMGEPDDEKDDFTDYDGELLKNLPAEGNITPTYAGRPRDFRCDKCDKAYIGKAGLGRHFKNNPDHGDPADLGITYDDEEEKSEGTPAKPVHMPPIRRKRRGRPPAGRPPNGDPDFLPNKCTPVKASPATRPTIDLGAQALHRRKQRIQELIKTIGDEDLMELALLRLSKAITVWEFLLMKVEEAHLQKLPFQEILQHFESVRKHVRLFANECLEKVSSKCNKQDNNGAQSEKNAPENNETAASSKSESSKSDEVPSSSDMKEEQTDDTVEREMANEQNNKDNQQKSKDIEPSLVEGSETTEIQTKTTSNADTESSTSESNGKVTENDEASSESEQPSESNVDESTNRTDDKESKVDEPKNRTDDSESKLNETTNRTDDKEKDRKVDKEYDSKIDKENDSEMSKSTSASADNVGNSASKSSPEIPTDFLELDEEIAKVLGMEVGRYRIRDWTSTALPAMYRFSKKVQEEEEESPSEEEADNGEPAEKRQRMGEAASTTQISSSPQKEKQVTRIQLPKENSSKQPPTVLSPAPGTKMQLVVHNNSNEYKPATVPMSLKAVEPTVSAAGDATPSSAANKEQQQVVGQTVTSAPHPVAVTAAQPVEDDIQPMETEQSNRASKSEENAEETTEAAVEYQTEEQTQSSIVPEGSTIMQMEDGTFLVQKPDGSAMQIHCPDGMTIETIQALLSMDASNVLQAAE